VAEKASAEIREKEERRQAGKRALDEWYTRKATETDARKKTNKEEEWAFLELREQHKKSKNPWEQIIDNCEMNKSRYSGTSDVTRMR
jgi:hypothetical protein